MARPALATVDDLERLLGEDVPNEGRAEALLEQASEIVRAYAQTTWLSDDQDELVDVPGAIPGVVTAMVDRATANPGGITQESAGPFSRSFGADAAQRLYLTAGEKSVIRFALGATTTLGVIATTRGPMETPDVTCGHGYLEPSVEESDPYALWP